MGSNGITQIGSFTVCSVDKDGNKEFLGTLDSVKLIETVTNAEPEATEDRAEMIFSLLKPDEATFTGKLTLLTRIKLRLLWRKAKIQMWWAYRKFKWSFDKAEKAQKKHEKVLKGELKWIRNLR